MAAPFFSVVIPTFNRAQLLQKAIASVLQQTFANWELVVVDDGSTDNTEQIVHAFKDLRIKYFYQQNAERSAARNNGILNSNGQYICFLDSDDYYLPNRLELLHAEITKRNQPIAFFYTGIAYEKEGIVTPKHEAENTFSNITDFIVEAVIGTPQACIHRVILSKQNFDTNIRIGEDMELWLRITATFPIIHLANQITVIALNHEDRSVNVKRVNSYLDTLVLFKYVFQKNHPGHNVSKHIKAKIAGNCYFGIAKYYIYQQKRLMAILYLIKSITADTNSRLIKFRINVILRLLTCSSFKKIESIID